MDTVFLIDFGMTGSGAECLIIPSPDAICTVKHHKFEKIPTRILYGEMGEVISWGFECETNGKAKALFKNHCWTKEFSAPGGNTSGPKNPSSTEELEKWISDYLHHFCSRVLDEVLRRENTIKEQLSAKWYLTTPGCWDDSTRLDFKMLAWRVLDDILPGSEVFANIDESLTSCEFLVEHFQWPSGTWVITCDIGGATCDTALASIQINGGILTPDVYPVASKGSQGGGVNSIDKYFWKILQSLLVGSAPFLTCRLSEMSPVSFINWPSARHAFDGSEDIVLTAQQELGIWKHPEGKLSIEGSKIIIQRQEMEKIFAPFLKGVYSEIILALDKLQAVAPRDTRPGAIALCGGGGPMAYLLKQLRLRYNDKEKKIEILTTSSIEESCLATVTGHGIYRLRGAVNDYLSDVLLGISYHSSAKVSQHAITWHKNPTRLTTFEFASKTTVRHYFMVSRKSCSRPLPVSLLDLKTTSDQWDGALIWTLDVTLDKNWLWKQKYCIEVTCTAINVFCFKAYDARYHSTEFKLVARRFSSKNLIV